MHCLAHLQKLILSYFLVILNTFDVCTRELLLCYIIVMKICLTSLCIQTYSILHYVLIYTQLEQ